MKKTATKKAIYTVVMHDWCGGSMSTDRNTLAEAQNVQKEWSKHLTPPLKFTAAVVEKAKGGKYASKIEIKKKFLKN